MCRIMMMMARICLPVSLALVFLQSCARASLVRRDEHELVFPLTYDPSAKLMTASISIGTPASSYNLILDTGSPFLVLQDAFFRQTSTTWDPYGEAQPDIGGGGYITTTPEPTDNEAEPVKPKMHFLVDTAYLNQGTGRRAGGGANGGNVTIGLTKLDDLRSAQGILGFSPPLDRVGPGFNAPSPPKGEKGKGKGKRDDSSENAPSLDVSFLHSYLSYENKKTLGIKGSSHFYLNCAASTSTSPPTGELVLPLSGNNLPRNIENVDYDATITIDPSSGSTFPAHPFWGIAHRPDLSFFLDDSRLDDVKIDAIIFDSGTSGIIAPPSEVRKIFDAVGTDRIRVSSPGHSLAVVGKARCDENFRMGFELGKDKKASFGVLRKTVETGDSLHNNVNVDLQGGSHPTVGAGLTAWKSYVDPEITDYVNGLNRVVGGVVGGISNLFHNGISLGLRKRKRSIHTRRKRTLQLGVDLLGGTNPQSDGAEPHGDECDVTIMGSPQVEAMFASKGPDLKIWIVGLEFFQHNVVYHNIDTAVTAIVPRKNT